MIGRYEVERDLGSGGMALVFCARDLRHDRLVAIKVLRPELALVLGAERFLQEIEIIARLTHPHILPLHDSGDAGGLLYYVMPYLEGESLRDRLEREHQLPLEQALRIARDIADALSYAHMRGVIHRDIKPENILFEAGHAVLSDFGIARAVSAAGGERLTEPGIVVGSPAYMSPEQAAGEGQLDGRSDVYSLACVVYEMLAGAPPFTGPTVHAILARRVADPVPPLRTVRETVPIAVEQAIMCALARAPADRFATAGAFAEALTSQSVKPSRRSVAVLPFVDLSANPENEYFADGITEDVIAQLAKIGSLKVISRTSVMQFKTRGHDLRAIAQRLGVATVLEGSVRRAEKRVRIVAQLIDAETDGHLWAETYDRELTDVLSIQSDAALHIAAALKAELSPDVRSRIEQESTSDLEAYHLYLQGRRCFFRMTDEGFRRSLEFYEKAVAKDPRYALAYTGIALHYVLIGMGYGVGAVDSVEAYSRAKGAVAKALESDPGLGEAHALLGLLKFVADYDWIGGDREVRRAIELNPGSADTYDIYGLMLSSLERYDEAVAAQKHAQELDPLAPVVTSDLASTLLRAGRYDEAMQEAQRLIEFEPRFPMGHSAFGWACLKKEMRDEGLAALERAVSLSPENTMLLAQLGQAYATVGKIEEGRQVLQRLEALARQRYVSPYHMAYVYTGLGEHDTALDLLERAVEERAGGVYGMKGSFLFTTLRTHPRFTALLRKLNLK